MANGTTHTHTFTPTSTLPRPTMTPLELAPVGQHRKVGERGEHSKREARTKLSAAFELTFHRPPIPLFLSHAPTLLTPGTASSVRPAGQVKTRSGVGSLLVTYWLVTPENFKARRQFSEHALKQRTLLRYLALDKPSHEHTTTLQQHGVRTCDPGAVNSA